MTDTRKKESGIMKLFIIPEFMLSSASLTALRLFNLLSSLGTNTVIGILVMVLPSSAFPTPGKTGASVRELVIFQESTHQHKSEYNHHNDDSAD